MRRYDFRSLALKTDDEFWRILNDMVERGDIVKDDVQRVVNRGNRSTARPAVQAALEDGTIYYRPYEFDPKYLPEVQEPAKPIEPIEALQKKFNMLADLYKEQEKTIELMKIKFESLLVQHAALQKSHQDLDKAQMVMHSVDIVDLRTRLTKLEQRKF